MASASGRATPPGKRVRYAIAASLARAGSEDRRILIRSVIACSVSGLVGNSARRRWSVSIASLLSPARFAVIARSNRSFWAARSEVVVGGATAAVLGSRGEAVAEIGLVVEVATS